jgi:WD40 repeat protein
VALKIIKLGMDTKSVIARFEAERQALALMDHPNIAKVHDAGATDTGRPYFVMELGRGVPVTRFCEENQLGITERLELFIQVCGAVQHAHQKGVIHRDIKPTNVLVALNDGVPHPMLIDFGVAKAINQRLTEKTLFTNFSQMIGTPAYMSPEQAEMSKLDVDTRSDIYSLGVLLYELLTGTTPFPEERLRSAGYVEIQRIISEEKPPLPSTRLTRTASPKPDSSPAAGRPPLSSDLDWIVMKCLEKDRTRRYATANGLAMDLKRHLNNEPVMARPPSRLYEFRKSAQRHKVGFAATAAIILVLFSGVLVSTWQAMRATHAQREALAAQANEAKEKAAAQQELYDSLVGQARATRLARQPGYRNHVFELLEKAKALDVPQQSPADLRDEAVACLGEFVGLTPATFTNFPAPLLGPACLAPSGELAAFALSDGTIQLLQMPSGKAVARLARPSPNEVFHKLCFDSIGGQLFAIRLPPMTAEQKTIQTLLRWRLYSWTCDPGGRWRQTTHGALPGVVDLLNDGKQVFATVADVQPPGADAPGSFHVKLRLFNLHTGAFVPGYDLTETLTNPLPLPFGFADAKTPGGGLIVWGTQDSRNSNSSVMLGLYDWKTGRRINQLPLPMMGALSLSPDGKYLAWLAQQGGGAIYAVPGLERIAAFKEYFEGASAVFSENMVALWLYQQQRLRLWNLGSREDIALLDQAGAPEDFSEVFSPQGNSLLTVSEDETRCYRLTTAEKLNLPSHAAAVTGVAFSPDGTRLASVGKDRVIRVCDARTGRMLWQTNDLPGPGQCVGYSPDGRWLATGDWDTGQVWIWDAHTGRRLLRFGTKGPGRTWSAEFSPDGRYLATTGGNETRIWMIEPGTTTGAKGGPYIKLVTSWPKAGRSLVLAPDSRSLAFYHPFSAVYWLDLETTTPARLVTTDNLAGVQAESFTPDSRQLMVMDTSREIVTLDVATGKRVSSVPTGEAKDANGFVNNFCLSPDGAKLAFDTPSMQSVEVWDPRVGQRLYSLPEAPGTVYWLAWSPDSRRLAVARANGHIAIWNLETVNQILTRLGLNP